MHEDGTKLEIGQGDAYVIEPGHDAWVLGDERFVGFEFESAIGGGIRQGLNGRLALQGSPTGRWRLPCAGPATGERAKSDTDSPRPPMARSGR